MKYSLLVFLLIVVQQLKAEFAVVYRDTTDSSRNCYALILPKTSAYKGLIIRDYSSLPDVLTPSPYKFNKLAKEAGYIIMYTVTSDGFPDFFETDRGPALLDSMIQEVVLKYKLPADQIHIGGISASGTRALRFVQYCNMGKSAFDRKLRSVFAVDPPLDLLRFYFSCGRIIGKQDPLADDEEARMVSRRLRFELGDPSQLAENYLRASVFTQSDPKGGMAIHLLNTPLRIYHEPDLDWWAENRNADLYDTNSQDIFGLVRYLEKLEAPVEHIRTSGQGKDRKGNRKPHSWTIVDETELIDWIQAQ